MIKLILKVLKKGGNQVFNLPIFEKIKGYKTLIISTITVILGAVIYLQEALHGQIGKMACDVGITYLCDVTGSKLYGFILIVIGFLNKVLRLVTDFPVPGIDDNKKIEKNG